MSRYEWEEGEFTIPAAEWSRVKKDIRSRVNDASARSYVIAEDIYKSVTSIRPKIVGDAAYRKASDILRIRYQKRDDSDDILYKLFRGSDTTIARPAKKDFPIYKTADTHLSEGACSVHFDNDTRTIKWHVHENNHACERAREGALGSALFSVLSTVKWTRGTGGRVWGNDEYNADSGRNGAGCGGCYEKETYGPQSKTSKAGAGLSRAYSFNNFR